MARITVEDCLEKIRNQYDLVLLAKERTSQLNAGDKPLISKDNDKNTVISLREIGDGKISLKTLEDSAINKLRKHQEKEDTIDDIEEESGDSFEKIYKGEVSKSGAAILPSKRVRRIPDKIFLENKKAEKNSTEEKENEQKIEEKKPIITEKKSEE